MIKLALCGFGAAGKARLDAIHCKSKFSLAGIISRRPEVSTLEFNTALADDSIEAIAISTENTDHAMRVRECLTSGKHVLCDYPLALSKKEAVELLSLAREKNKTE